MEAVFINELNLTPDTKEEWENSNSINSVLMTNINFYSIMKQELTFNPY